MSKQVTLVNSVGISFGSVRIIIGAFSVYYLLGQGLTLTQVGWIKSFQAAVIVFVDIPLSYYADKYSRKFSICLSALCATIWLFLTGISNSFIGFLSAEFFNALSLGLMSGTFNSYLYDVALNNNKNERAERIFSKYQKYNFFFMGIISLTGSAIYAVAEDEVWLITSGLMFIVFIFSLFLPSDKKTSDIIATTFIKTLVNIKKSITGNKISTKHYIISNIIISLFLQIMIQYWQVMVQYRSAYIDQKILLGIAFFLILMAQSFSGMFVEFFFQSARLKAYIMIFLIMSFIVACLSYIYPILTILALCFIFFSIASINSLSLSRLVENVDASMRSTMLSSVAVLSKIMMLLTMPICALIISYSGIGFALLLIAIISIFIKYIIPVKKSQSEEQAMTL